MAGKYLPLPILRTLVLVAVIGALLAVAAQMVGPWQGWLDRLVAGSGRAPAEQKRKSAGEKKDGCAAPVRISLKDLPSATKTPSADDLAPGNRKPQNRRQNSTQPPKNAETPSGDRPEESRPPQKSSVKKPPSKPSPSDKPFREKGDTTKNKSKRTTSAKIDWRNPGSDKIQTPSSLRPTVETVAAWLEKQHSRMGGKIVNTMYARREAGHPVVYTVMTRRFCRQNPSWRRRVAEGVWRFWAEQATQSGIAHSKAQAYLIMLNKGGKLVGGSSKDDAADIWVKQ